MDFQKKLWYDRQKNERNYEIEKTICLSGPGDSFSSGFSLRDDASRGDAHRKFSGCSFPDYAGSSSYKKEPKPEKKYSRRSLWLLPFVGMAGNTLFSLILNAVHLTEHFSNASQEALFQSNLLLQIIGIGLFVPFVEELVFRGLVYGKMRRLFSFRVAAAVSAALFALYHGNIVQLVYAFPMGLLLAWSYERWGSLSAPVLLHIGANLLGILETVIRRISIR